MRENVKTTCDSVIEWIGKADWGDVPTWFAGFVAVAALGYASMQVKGMREQNMAAKAQEETQRKLESDRLRPVVVAYFERNLAVFPVIEFVVKNVGAGTAYNVAFDFRSCPILSSDMKEEPFWKARYLADGVDVIAPGHEMRCFADDANRRGDENWPEGRCDVQISYESIAREEFSETNRPDMNLYQGSLHLDEKRVHHIAKELTKIREKLGGAPPS